MELRKETVKQIRGLIVFTALLIVCLWKYDVVMDAFRFVLNILYPFLLGGAIAFVLSVPMNFVERKLFTERKLPEKYKRKYARGISLLIVLSGVIGLLAIIMFGLIPQLAGTFASLGKSIQDFIPQLQEWADHWFHNNKEIMNVVNNLEFDWNKVMEAAMEFLKNGAGSMLESTINTAKISLVPWEHSLSLLYLQCIFCCRKKSWEDRRKKCYLHLSEREEQRLRWRFLH